MKFIPNFDPRFIFRLINISFYFQPLFCGRIRNKVNYRCKTFQRVASPVFAHERKHLVFYFVPLAGFWGKWHI